MRKNWNATETTQNQPGLKARKGKSGAPTSVKGMRVALLEGKRHLIRNNKY